MMTLRQFAAKPETVLLTTAWYLADLGEARGRQELFAKQSPQRLRGLRDLQVTRQVESLGRGPGAVWRTNGTTFKNA